MRTRKIILLFFALLLPVCIFLFLKIFGKNQFDVPLLYDKGVAIKPDQCNFEYPTPYYVPDSIIQKISPKNGIPLVLLNFSTNAAVIDRVGKEADASEIRITNVAFSDEVKNCVLLLKSPNDLVLVDSKKQIRGYYTSSDREDVDRLLIEISIILKKY